MDDTFTRIRGLVGDDEFKNVSTKRVLIVGLGGVGGTVFSALVRSGVGSFHIIDFDNVEASNLNRQILFDINDIGKLKTEVANARALGINPEVKIKGSNAKINKENINEILDGDYDYICDACDNIEAKVSLAKYAISHNIPFIMSGGAANTLSIEEVKVTTLDKVTGDHLLKRVRDTFKTEEIDLKLVNCAFAAKKEQKPCSSQLNSAIFATSTMGLAIASHIFKSLL